jgi:iron complex outermembrane receptor protein
VSGEYAVPIGDGQVMLRADYHYTSLFFHEPGQGENRFGSVIPLTREPSYGLLDLRVGYQRDDWRLTAFVTNVTDKVYRRSVNAIGSTAVGFAGEPRIYGLRLAKDF